MKKLLPALIIASVSITATANVGSPYVQGLVGTSKLDVKDDRSQKKAKGSDTAFSVAVGRDYGATRYALDYTHFGELEHKETGFDVAGDYRKTNVKAQSVGVSAFYDFTSVSGFTPYVGARVGVNKLNLDISNKASVGAESFFSSTTAKKTQVGLGAVAGVSYAINPQWTIDGGVEYNHLGKVDNFKVKGYGGKIGVRYNF